MAKGDTGLALVEADMVGHRVPAYRVDPFGKTPRRWIVAASESEARARMTAEERSGCNLE